MVRPMRDDAQLVSLAKKGDRDAFAALAERYRGLLHAAAYSVLHSRDEAEDVAQEAVVRIFARLQSFREDAGFARWAYVVARNLAIARLRSRSREVPMDVLAETAAPQVEHDTPGLHACLTALPETMRDTVLMYYVGGYTGEEIAQALGVAPGTVRSRLTRARRILRGELISMVRRELSELMSREEYAGLVEWLRAFPAEEPYIAIEEVDAPLPDPDVFESPGFFVPLKTDGLSFIAWYDHPERTLTDTSFMRVLGKAEIAGQECWEVCMVDSESRGQEQYKMWYWTVGADGIKLVAKYFSDADRLMTCKDEDWDEDQRGHPRYPARLPFARRVGEDEYSDPQDLPLVPVGAYDVTIGTKVHRCLRVIEARFDEHILVDAYINADGRTVLFRRYNSGLYWSRRTPGLEHSRGAVERLAELGNHRIVFNGVEYYHWYDCITDTAMQCAPPMVHGQRNRWYHGSTRRLNSLAVGSAVTPAIELARAFSHAPTRVDVRIQDGDAGHNVGIEHNGTSPGYVYEVLVEDASTDLTQHPESGFFPGEEMLTELELRVRLVEETEP